MCPGLVCAYMVSSCAVAVIGNSTVGAGLTAVGPAMDGCSRAFLYMSISQHHARCMWLSYQHGPGTSKLPHGFFNHTEATITNLTWVYHRCLPVVNRLDRGPACVALLPGATWHLLTLELLDFQGTTFQRHKLCLEYELVSYPQVRSAPTLVQHGPHHGPKPQP